MQRKQTELLRNEVAWSVDVCEMDLTSALSWLLGGVYVLERIMFAEELLHFIGEVVQIRPSKPSP